MSAIDQAEIVVPYTNTEITSLWVINEDWQIAHSNSKYLKNKRTNWVLLHIVKGTRIPEVPTFYIDSSKSGMAGYLSQKKISKVTQSPYASVMQLLYAILTVLLDFPEPLNIITGSRYAERVVLHIDILEFTPDNSELTLLFMQLQQAIRNRNYPLYRPYLVSYSLLRFISTRI